MTRISHIILAVAGGAVSAAITYFMTLRMFIPGRALRLTGTSYQFDFKIKTCVDEDITLQGGVVLCHRGPSVPIVIFGMLPINHFRGAMSISALIDLPADARSIHIDGTRRLSNFPWISHPFTVIELIH